MRISVLGKDCRISLYEVQNRFHEISWLNSLSKLFVPFDAVILSELSNSFACFLNFLRFAFSVLRRILPEDKVESVTGMTLTTDGNGAVFDVKKEDVDAFLAGNILFYRLILSLP